MTLGIFARAMKAGLSKFGEPSSLDGVVIGKVAIERGVEIFDGVNRSVNSFGGQPLVSDGQYVAHHDVATLPASVSPVIGQTLVHPDGTFRLTRRLSEDGCTIDFVIAEA